jgi:hypothetical protein
VPQRTVTGRLDLLARNILVGRLQLLQADYVRLLLGQIFHQPLEPGANAVEVVGDDLHRG